ncbi:hypothetical protein [Streptococcus phage SG005]|nr:hypothetical protein [Streptococcus phage SG005]
MKVKAGILINHSTKSIKVYETYHLNHLIHKHNIPQTDKNIYRAYIQLGNIYLDIEIRFFLSDIDFFLTYLDYSYGDL